jgi:hypothetical protein
MRRKWPIVLLGWYLLAPPTSVHQIIKATSFANWVQLGTYDQATDCQEHLEMTQHGKNPSISRISMKDQAASQVSAASLEEARCVASDDPRLLQ